MNQDVLIFLIPISIAIIFALGFTGRAILKSKGYSGAWGFVLGILGIPGLIIACVIPSANRSDSQVLPKIPATPSESYSSLSPSTYNDDPRNDWNSLSAQDQGNLMRDIERKEREDEERNEFIRGLFSG